MTEGTSSSEQQATPSVAQSPGRADNSEEITLHGVGVDALEDAVHEALDQLFPANQELGLQPTRVSLVQLTMHRLLCKDAIEQCEDPLIEAKRQELTRKNWIKLAPSRFKQPLEGFSSMEQSETVPQYQRHSPGAPGHPGKRKATSPPPGQKEREEELHQKYTSKHALKKAVRSSRNKQERNTALNSEIYVAKDLKLEQLRFTSTGWQGVDADSYERTAMRKKLHSRDPAFMAALATFTLVPYEDDGPATRIVDSEGRLFIYRSRRSLWQKEALPSLASAIQRFAERTVVKAEERAGNLRGPQNFCIAGTDRQSKGQPGISSWHRQGNNDAELDILFQNPAMVNFNDCITAAVYQHFPHIAKRMEDGNATIVCKYGLPQGRFGLFCNFCVNSPMFEEGICDVFCDPHTDAKNAAVLVCAVLVYYYGNCETTADERIWLVFYEARLIMQVPAGVFVLYPSALFLHFNVHIEDVLVYTKDGSPPTRENAIPLRESNTENGGRGSMVWFTQASMLVSAELPTDSIKQANNLNKQQKSGEPLIPTTFNAVKALEDGFFPCNTQPAALED
ncbi:hypothetical protein BC629DRAFT_1535869 [Irpex lacteus]|nr:hypothetical protein BC629DRAFT_1535869 [Irpex lacteus]